MKMVSDIMSIHIALEKLMSKVLKEFCLASHAKEYYSLLHILCCTLRSLINKWSTSFHTNSV